MIQLEVTQAELDFIVAKFDADIAQGKNWLVSAVRRNDKVFTETAFKHVDENENLRRRLIRQAGKGVTK